MDQAKIYETLLKVLANQTHLSEEQRNEIAFHMTDWIHNLEAWCDFCEAPENVDIDDTERLLNDFLIHVPNHLAAASKLMLGIPVTDIFGVSATSDND